MLTLPVEMIALLAAFQPEFSKSVQGKRIKIAENGRQEKLP